MHNLLVDPLIRVRRLDGVTEPMSLPEVYVAMASDGVAGFPALRPHQRHAWHAFLAQLGVIARRRADCDTFPDDAAAWRELLRGLTREFGDDEPWRLIVEDPARPAFMQCPAPKGLTAYRTLRSTPDDLDILIASKNHAPKRAVAVRGAPDDWIFALVNLQTMAGFLGQGNFGVARMNGGFSGRPCLGFAPAGGGCGAHLFHDMRRMLAQRDALAARHALEPNRGLALLWLHPWDGADSVSLDSLDPYFIEICRRVRLRLAGRGLVARTAPSKQRRIDAKVRRGNVGDFWTPVTAKDPRALSVSATSFLYQHLYALLFEYRRVPAMNVDPTVNSRWRLVARGIAGGQGKTGGYHERTDVVLSAATVKAWLGGDRSDALAALAERQMDEVREVVLALQFGIAVAASGGQAPEALTRTDRLRAYPYLDRLHAVADAHFFPKLDARFLARDAAASRRLRQRFVRVLLDAAESLLAEASNTVAPSTLLRQRAGAQAASAFAWRLRQEKSVLANESEILAARRALQYAGARVPRYGGLDVALLARDIVTLAPTDMAALLRGRRSGAVERLMAAHAPSGTTDVHGWAVLFRSIVMLTPRIRDARGLTAHDPGFQMGAALFAAGTREARFAHLVAAQRERRRRLVLRTCSQLSATSQNRFDLWSLVWFVLCDDSSSCRETTDRWLARDYYRAAARAATLKEAPSE